MANIHPLSATGKYWIDCEMCLDHGFCGITAPENIRDDDGIWYVYKQPTTVEEDRKMLQAMMECPVEAIH